MFCFNDVVETNLDILDGNSKSGNIVASTIYEKILDVRIYMLYLH